MIRRVLFGLFWFLVFALGLTVIGGGIAGATAGDQVSSPDGTFRESFGQGYEVGVEAGAHFRERYGWMVLAAAALLAAGGTIKGALPGTRR